MKKLQKWDGEDRFLILAKFTDAKKIKKFMKHAYRAFLKQKQNKKVLVMSGPHGIGKSSIVEGLSSYLSVGEIECDVENIIPCKNARLILQQRGWGRVTTTGLQIRWQNYVITTTGKLSKYPDRDIIAVSISGEGIPDLQKDFWLQLWAQIEHEAVRGKYYYLRTSGGLCLTACPKKSRFRIGSGKCQMECKHGPKRDKFKDWVKCKHIKKITDNI